MMVMLPAPASTDWATPLADRHTGQTRWITAEFASDIRDPGQGADGRRVDGIAVRDSDASRFSFDRYADVFRS
jgi:hypothetical protein